MNYLTKIKQHIELDKTYRIVFIGDSITSTEWVHPNWREIIEYVLKDELAKQMQDWWLPSWNIRTINSGLDGSTIKDLLDRYEEYVAFYKPNLVIYIQTSNERHQNIDPESAANMNVNLVSKLKEQGVDFILTTTTSSNNQSYNQIIQAYVNNFRDKLGKDINADLFEKFQTLDLDKIFTFVSNGNEDEGIKPGEIDYMHPNQLGNAFIAKFILEAGFGIDFDPQAYMADTISGEMFPGY